MRDQLLSRTIQSRPPRDLYLIISLASTCFVKIVDLKLIRLHGGQETEDQPGRPEESEPLPHFHWMRNAVAVHGLKSYKN